METQSVLIIMCDCEFGGLHGAFKGGIFVSGHGWTFWPSSSWR